MKTEQINLEVINNRQVLARVLRCIQRRRISIHSFLAEESSEKLGTIIFRVGLEKEQLQVLIAELKQVKDVRQVAVIAGPLPSRELSSIYEE